MINAFVIVLRQYELLHVIGTLYPGGGFTHLLHGGQEESDQDGNDGDHYQKLDQCEGITVGSRAHGSILLVQKDIGAALRTDARTERWSRCGGGAA